MNNVFVCKFLSTWPLSAAMIFFCFRKLFCPRPYPKAATRPQPDPRKRKSKKNSMMCATIRVVLISRALI